MPCYIKGDRMKKYIYIIGVIFSIMSFTACEQRDDGLDQKEELKTEEQGNVDIDNKIGSNEEESNQEVAENNTVELEATPTVSESNEDKGPANPVSYEIQASIHEGMPTYRFVAKGSKLNDDPYGYGYVMGLEVYDENGNLMLSEDYSQVAGDELVGNSVYNEMMDTMGLHVTDINFDGYKDVIILESFGGAHGNTWYYGYVWNSDEAKFIPAPSFTEIANPALDKESRSIYSTGGQGASSSRWVIYQYIDSKFTITNELSLEMLDNKYQLVEKKSENGNLEVIRTNDIDSNDYDEALKTAGYVDDDLWKLDNPRWYGIGGPEASKWLE